MAKARELKQASAEQKERLQQEIKALRAALKVTWEEWVDVTRDASKQYKFSH
jgi:hypothetical protein